MTAPDADELAIRAHLHHLLDSPATPDAVSTAADTARPAVDQDDWWDALYSEPTVDAQPKPEPRRIPPWWTGRHVDLTPPTSEEDTPDDDSDVGTAPETEPVTEAADDTVTPDETDVDTADTQPARPRIRIPARLQSRTQPQASPGDVVAAPAPRMSLLEAYGRIPPRIRWLTLHTSAAAAGYRLGWVQWSTSCTAWIHAHGWANTTAGFWIGAVVGCELLRRRLRYRVLPVRWAAAIPIASLVTGALLYGTGWQTLELPL